MMGWNGDSGAWLGMGLGMVLWVIVVVLVVWLLVRGLLALERTRSGEPTQQAPDAILRERFARGDIDADEFERRLTVLHSS